jgi:NADH:ubiquinone oxidoreductase subunit C
MSTLSPISQELELGGEWEERGGSYWMTPEAMSPREITLMMNAHDARFITITATQLPDDEGIQLLYHWDLEGKVLTFTFTVTDKQVESIYDICEAANWIEREIHEYFAIDYIDRPYEPLFLREGETPGVNLREEDE